MTATAWTDFCESLADLPVDEIQKGDVDPLLGSDELRAWYEALPLGPHQIVNDALQPIKARDLKDAIQYVLSPIDNVEPHRRMRAAFRDSAIAEAIYQAEAIRQLRDVEAAIENAPARHWRVPDHFDAVAEDRKALAAEHARMLREESTR